MILIKIPFSSIKNVFLAENNILFTPYSFPVSFLSSDRKLKGILNLFLKVLSAPGES